MMLPTDAAMTTRRSSFSGTLEALAMVSPREARGSFVIELVSLLSKVLLLSGALARGAGRVAAQHTGFPSSTEVFRACCWRGARVTDAARDPPSRPTFGSAMLLACDSGLHRRLGDRRGDGRHHPRIEHRRRDVLLAQLA